MVKLTNTLMCSRTNLETRLGAVLHTYEAELSARSVRGAKYYVFSIDEASGNVSTCHMETRPEVAGFLKQSIHCVGLRTDCPVMKTLLEKGKEYIKETTEPVIDGIEVSVTAR